MANGGIQSPPRSRARRRFVAASTIALVAALWVAARSDDVPSTAHYVDLRGPANLRGAAVTYVRPVGPYAAVAAPKHPVLKLDVDTSGFDRSGGTTDDLAFNGYPVTRYAHEDEPWAPTHFRELNTAWSRADFFLGVRPLDLRGRTLNIRDGVRVSYTPDRPRITVWFFGGSAMYGIGQRDDHTIPSVVAHLAERDGVRIRALNFGVSADVNWQETQRFAEALTSGQWPKPDLVVFYDGANDLGLASARIDAGSISPNVIDRSPVSAEERAAWVDSNSPRPNLDANGQPALQIELGSSQYGRGVRLGRRLAAVSGIHVVHFWQPLLLMKRPSPSDVELYRELGVDDAAVRFNSAVYEGIREQSGADPVDLSRVLDRVTVPVYFDWSHTNEYGARLVATALYDHIRGFLVDAD